MSRLVPHVVILVRGTRASFVSEHDSKGDATEEAKRLRAKEKKRHDVSSNYRAVKAETWHGGEFWTSEGDDNA